MVKNRIRSGVKEQWGKGGYKGATMSPAVRDQKPGPGKEREKTKETKRMGASLNSL